MGGLFVKWRGNRAQDANSRHARVHLKGGGGRRDKGSTKWGRDTPKRHPSPSHPAPNTPPPHVHGGGTNVHTQAASHASEQGAYTHGNGGGDCEGGRRGVSCTPAGSDQLITRVPHTNETQASHQNKQANKNNSPEPLDAPQVPSNKRQVPEAPLSLHQTAHTHTHVGHGHTQGHSTRHAAGGTRIQPTPSPSEPKPPTSTCCATPHPHLLQPRHHADAPHPQRSTTRTPSPHHAHQPPSTAHSHAHVPRTPSNNPRTLQQPTTRREGASQHAVGGCHRVGK